MTVLRLTGRPALQDLATFTGRARRVDPDGAARLALHGGLLATYVSPLHEPGGPTVLGLRVTRLAPSEQALDVVVPLLGLADRFARIIAGGLLGPDAPVELSLPPQQLGVDWAGMSPPRQGWEPAGSVTEAVLRQAARDGVDEVAAGAGTDAAALAVSKLRAAVWGRPLPGSRVEGLPAGAAFAADALGLLAPGQAVPVHRAGRWLRLSCRHGHVLTRPPLL